MALNIANRNKDKCKTHILNRFKISENYQKTLFVNFNEYYRIYRGIIDSRKQNYNGRANLFVPYVFSVIEDTFPRMISNKPKLQILPREQNDIENAKVLEQLLDYQWYALNMRRVMKDWVKQMLLYGTGVVKTAWEFEPITGIDQPSVKVVDLLNFFVDSNAFSIQDAQFVVHRTWKDLEELKKNENYQLPRDLKGAAMIYSDYETQRDAITNKTKENDSTQKKIEILEYWGLYDLDGDGNDEECLITIANKNNIIRAELNPFEHQKKPFIEVKDISIPNEFWGIGEIEPLVSLQYELNDIRNQRMDNVTQILRNQPILSRQAGVEPYEVEQWMNGNILRVNGHPEAAVGFSRPPDVTASSYNEETLVKGDIQNVTGIGGFGATVAGRNVRTLQQDTATGAMLQQEEANFRFRSKLDNLEWALTELGQQLVQLNQQFWDQEKVIRIIGEQNKIEFKKIRSEDIQGNFDIIVEAGSTMPMNKGIQRAEAIQLVNTLAPFVGSGMINSEFLIKNLLQTYDIKNIQEALLSQRSGTAQQMAPMDIAASIQLNPPAIPEETLGGIAGVQI